MQKADAMGLILTSLWSVDEIRGEVQGGIPYVEGCGRFHGVAMWPCC